MTKETEDPKLKTPLSQSAVQGIVMPGPCCIPLTAIAENIIGYWIDGESTPEEYGFKDEESMLRCMGLNVEPIKTKA